MNFSAFSNPRAKFRAWAAQNVDYCQLWLSHPDIIAGTKPGDWSRDEKRGFMMQNGAIVSPSAEVDARSIVYGKGKVTGLTKVVNSLIGGEVTRSARVTDSHIMPGGVLTGQAVAFRARINRADTLTETKPLYPIVGDAYYIAPLLQVPTPAQVEKVVRKAPVQRPQQHQHPRPIIPYRLPVPVELEEMPRARAAAYGD